MARLVFNAGDVFTIGGSNTVTDVFGSSGKDTITIAAGSKATLFGFDSTDAISLGGNAGTYTAVRSGSSIVLTDAAGSSVTIPVSTTSQTINFADGARALVYNSTSGNVELGSQAVTTTATTVTAGSGGGTTTAGQTFTLTANLDAGSAFTGGAGNDTYSANTSTLTVGDDLNGGAGTDTLSLSSNLTDPVSIGSFKTTGIENLSVNVQDGDTSNAEGLTLNMLNAAVSKVSLSGLSTTTKADTLTVNNLAAGASLELTSATDLKLAANYVAAATAGDADSVSLALTDVGSTADGDTVVTVGEGFETLNISTSGAAAVVGDIVFGGTKIVVTGDQNLTVRSALDTSINEIDASAFTGRLSVTTSALAAEKSNGGGSVDVVDLKVTGGSGNDIINLTSTASGEEILIDAGAGNDTVTIGAALTNAGTATAGDVVKGGAGTDTLVAGSALIHNVSAANAWTGLSGFETLSTAIATDDLVVNAANLSADITTVRLTAATSGAGATVNFAAGTGNTVTVAASAGIAAGDTLTVTSAGTGTADAVTVANGNAATGTNQFASATSNVTSTGVETLTINSGSYSTVTAQDVQNITMTASTGGTTALVITGSNGLTVAGTITAGSIDASAGGALSMSSAAAAGLTSITGSSKGDILRGDSSSTINGGAGNDTIVGGSLNDVLNGEDGNDDITADSGTDTVNGGAGNDTITFAGNLSAGDKVDGGEGTDTISLTNTSLGALKNLTISEANTFNDNFNNVERLTLTDALNQSSFDLGYLGGVNYVTLTAGITGDETLAGLDSGSTIALSAALGATLTATVNNASTGSSDSLTVVLASSSATVDYSDVSIANVETLTINVTESTASSNIREATIGLGLSQVTGGAAQTVRIVGTEALTIDQPVAAGTIDASGMTVALATDKGLTMGAGASVAQTITGSDKVDVLVGSTKSDTINGGAGADTITGGKGADTIDGGAGIDTITTAGMVSANVEGTGTGESLGVVINLSSAAVSAATVNVATGEFISSGLSAVAAGSAVYLFDTESSLNTTTADTITNVENVTLSGNGINYVVGSDAANVITGGTGVDTISGGAGNDTIRGGGGADKLTGGTGVDTFVFEESSNGSDTISDFTVGASGDVLNLDAALAAGATVKNTATNGLYVSPDATALATEGTSIAVNNQLLIINSGATAVTAYDTAAEVENLLANTGAWDAVDFADSKVGYLLVAANDGTTALLWQVNADATAGITAAELSLVGTLTIAADGIDALAAGNFVLVG